MNIVPIHLLTVDSTSTWARENYSHFDWNKITRITADVQTQGRGRFDRHWLSPKGENLYITYFFTTKKNLHSLSNLSQIFCLSVVKLLCEKDLSPKIKWPNDILVNERKISGVMCEVIDLRGIYGIFVGIGINVNMSQKNLDLIDQPATSFLREKGRLFLLTPLLTLLDQFFIEDLTLYQKEGFQPFYRTYNAFLICKKQRVTLHQDKKILTGIFHSLNPDGSLNLMLDSKEIKTITTTDRISLEQ